MTTQTSITKKRDRELIGVILIIGGIFTLPLLVIDFTYKNFGGMFTGPDAWIGVLWTMAHMFIIAIWTLVIRYWNDPNKNLLRVFLVIMHLIAFALIMGHRAGWLENKQVIIDSRNNK